MTDRETIAAISTGFGGGIGIVRLSGPRAREIAAEIFRPADPRKKVLELPGYSCTLGSVLDGEKKLDEALLLLFRAPRSYTGEDMAELSCHGGRFVLERVLALTVLHGAAPAGPGEFTQRAFLAGKMDLTQAESVADIIAAQSEQALRAAMDMKDGVLQREIAGVSGSLTALAAHIAALTDYPEEDVESLLPEDARTAVEQARDTLERLAATYDRGRMLREGISTAIVGSVNVGKSTLMNLLAGCEKSIVTDVPGTTRDVVEETVRIGELTLNLWDTAGLRDTADTVEKIGVSRSRERLKRCDLILAVFDGSRPLEAEDLQLLAELDGRLAVGVVNKSDAGCRIDMAEIAAHTGAVVEISALHGSGIDTLERTVRDAVGLSELAPSAALVANARQLACIREAARSLSQALEALELAPDAAAVCLQEALDSLLELTGQNASDAVVSEVFGRFCVGK